ncbi:MAG: MATE family efflux transporter [Butyricicoccus sp.]
MHYNKRDFSTDLHLIRPKKYIILEIYAVGLPAILMQALMSFMTYGVNIIFDGVSTAAVTAYGMYYKIQQFVFFAAFGMNNAIIPLVGFNFGMRNKKRIHQGIRWGIGYTLIIMLLGMIGLQIFAQPLIDVFTLSDETRRLCVLAIRIITLGYLFAGANIAYQGIFQALGAGIHSLVLSLIRLIIVALPLAWVFTKLPNAETLIWAAFPIAEGVALLVAFVLMHMVAKQQLKSIDNAPEQ